MEKFSFFPGASESTNLGFGTTSLMGAPSSKDRLALLETAFDAGIRHFDTAPYYGYGESERILGDFITGKREQVTITTKFGIQAPAVVKSRLVNLMARRILKLLPFMRETFSRKAQSFSKKGIFTPAEARRSLDQSLTALKTDHVDLFLLHEPTYADAASEEMHQFLEEEVRRGRIRAFGCGGDFSVIQSIAHAKLPTSSWLQFEDNVLSRKIELIRPTGARCITYRTFLEALAGLTGWLEAVPGRYAEWERQLHVNLHEEGALAGLLQAASHFRNPDGIVLFSTRRADRIKSAAQIASGNSFSLEQIQKFDELARWVSVQSRTAP
jgi:aryl-alcohol dehydrogenase-like predicted oxidoreductase